MKVSIALRARDSKARDLAAHAMVPLGRCVRIKRRHRGRELRQFLRSSLVRKESRSGIETGHFKIRERLMKPT